MDSRLSEFGWRTFNEWPEEEVHGFLAANNIIEARQLPDGTWSGLCQLMFTLSVYMDITPTQTFSYRWCFGNPDEARHMLANATEYDEVPVLRTSLKGHRYATGKPLYMEHDQLGIPKW